MIFFRKASFCYLLCSIAWTAHAIEENNLLVVYNSQSADSQAVHDYYVSLRPAVHSLDLNDPLILTPTVSYADFASQIRNPIRSHLSANNLEQSIMVIVLTKDIPHRIQSLNLNAPNTGDSPSDTATAYEAGNATFASVDSELTLLHFDLENGENGGEMDAPADRAVINPFFGSTQRFDSFSRSKITSGGLTFSERSFSSTDSWWELQEPRGFFLRRPTDAGAIYLTARLDAATVEDVKALIDRAQMIAFRKELDAIILDADARTERLDRYLNPINMTASTDYVEAESLLTGDWVRVFSDTTNSFLTGTSDPITLANTTLVPGPVAHLHSYGVNHSGTNSQIRDYLRTFGLQLPPGASFSAYESFGAVGLGGLGNKGQAQIEEWFAAGGTFATGPVWEPFTFGILKSEIFLDRFMNDGFTYVESAWAGILQLSWQSVVVGDPLATASFQPTSGYELWTFEQAGSTAYVNAALAFDRDFDADGQANGYEYILGLDPAVSDTDSTRKLGLQFSNDGPRLALKLDTKNAPHTMILVQSSETLNSSSWSTISTRDPSNGWAGTASVTETPNGGSLEVEIIDSAADGEKRFYRLSITEAQP